MFASSDTLLNALQWRYATKVFDGQRQIDAATWSTLERSLLLTASSYGLQPWKFLVIADPALRSHAVTALSIGAPNGLNLRRWTEHQAGLTLGIGLNMATDDDPNADGFFRIGHMGHVNAQMIMGTLGAIQSGLMALDIPHGEGGLEAAARVLAEATRG